jgi:hypothetical protein
VAGLDRRVLFFAEGDLVRTGNATIKTTELRSLAVTRLATESASGSRRNGSVRAVALWRG